MGEGLDGVGGYNPLVTLLYLDFTSPTVLFFLPTPNNKTAYASLTLRTKPAAWIKEAWVQAAWADSSTQNFKLTDAVRAYLATTAPPAFKTSYTTPKFSIWNQAEKGLPYTRYEY